MTDAAAVERRGCRLCGTLARIAPVLAVWTIFVAWSLLRSPIPGVNEPHYLCKARHLLEPTWCARDVFLASSNPHGVFYATVGPLARATSFETTALVGRAVGLLILAVGWTALVQRCVPGAWSPVAVALLFLASNAVGSLSGEWIVGGVESKVPAYGLVFLAWSLADRGRLVAAAACAGAAASLHPIVGGWGIVLWGGAALGDALFRVAKPASSAVDGEGREGPTHGRCVLAALVLVATLVPGFVAAWPALSRGTAEERALGDFLQVTYRLAHHIDPGRFPASSLVMYAGLLALWGGLLPFATRLRHRSRFAGIVCGSVLLAVAGLFVGGLSRCGTPDGRPETFLEDLPGWEWRIRVLKFYPFRTADVLVPLAASIALAGAWQAAVRRRRFDALGEESSSTKDGGTCPAWSAVAGLVVCGAASAAAALWHPARMLPPAMNRERRDAWLAVCRWVGERTPADALFVTPNESWAFKWFAQRAEYVCFKDCPQDAPGIVEWNRRLLWLGDWARAAKGNGSFGADDLRTLREETGAEYLIAGSLGPVDEEPEFAAGPYRVYRLDR